jgi:hypothetical protein
MKILCRSVNEFKNGYIPRRSLDSAVGIATGYGLDDRGVGIRIPVGQEFSFLHVVQTGSGVYPASYTMDAGGFSPGVKRQWPEADHSRTSAKVKKTWL